MHFSTGPSEHSWRPVVTAKSNTIDYWLNWRVLVCTIWVFSSMVIAAILIWKYEGPRRGMEKAEAQEEPAGTLYNDESWRPCLKEIHPAWLLAFRAIAFFILLALLVVSIVVQGGEMFYFYTQWTFALLTIYFGIGSLLSIYGCYKLLSKVDDVRPGRIRLDAENGAYVAPPNREGANASDRMKRDDCQEHHTRQVAGFWGYTFQIIYQTNAGAVMLTDCVFWLIIVPFLAIKDYNLNFFMIGMHSVNAIFLLGDTALNSLRFPWFRISYFLLWTVVYVIFQWVLHACIPIWWPYPFLDLASPYAPLWYFSVALTHIPCFFIFLLIIKTKDLLFSTLFPLSYRYSK
uniref:Signal recognition particle SEC65 subunit n=1 Tax=Anthurium amnicola TaxID=1678845 RepID=A0A1D1YS05_9ARAE